MKTNRALDGRSRVGNHRDSLSFATGPVGLLAAGLMLGIHAPGSAASAGPVRHAAASALPGATVAVVLGDREPALVVTSLRTGGEAELRGVRVGDRVLAIDGRPVRSRRDLRRVLAVSGDPIERLRLRRGAHTLAVALRRREMGTGHGASHIGRGR